MNRENYNFSFTDKTFIFTDFMLCNVMQQIV